MRVRRKSLLLFVVVCFVAATAPAQTITEFPLPEGSNAPFAIAAGPDGNLWFTEFSTNPKIGRITVAGAITEFPTPRPDATPAGIVAGPDGNLWFTQADYEMGFEAYISRITPAGVISQVPVGGFPYDIAAGSDGALWFTEANIQSNQIGRITIAGAVTSYRIPTPPFPWNIAAGPDGNLWFTEILGNKIGRLTTGGTFTEFALPTADSHPSGITAGPDGNIWFTESKGNRIGRITPSGQITEFSIPTASSGPRDITTGPDGNLWFVEENGNKVGRITTSGVVTEFSIPTPASRPLGIIAGPDGNIWFTEAHGNKIGRISLGGDSILQTRMLPVVGSTPGAAGALFRTSVQLHNSTSSEISGRVVFHASGVSGSASDPALGYSLAPGQTKSISDLLPAMGRSGLGSADIEVTSGSVPVATVRVFNDAGAAGTTGFTEEPMRSDDALRPGHTAVLLLPADPVNFRFNLGFRTLHKGATATLTLRDASGAVLTTISRSFPATYHEQQGAGAFLGVATLPPGGSIAIAVTSGAAIVYGATVDNRTGDPSLQLARVSP
ncbi:MAG: hypothetical protein M3542_13590 [Acidobacteriota bacterium]|nr:hypothetical protein [Acidobacteriota bacterium]MDQ5870591.1 hypothetical protein [Acidobacteriota bacterium]